MSVQIDVIPSSPVEWSGSSPPTGGPISLRRLRAIVGWSQESLAMEIGLSQSAICRFEQTLDHRISTLRQYVTHLGGELEIVITLKGDRYVLRHG